MTSQRLWLTLALVGPLMLGASAKVAAMPAPSDETASITPDAAPDLVRLAQAQPAPSTPASSSSTPASAATAEEPIGNVVTLTGTVTVIRNKNSLPLHLRDDIFLNDTVQTSSSSSLGITFNDATTFNLSANAKITIDNYVYEDGGKSNAGIFDIGKGTVAFVAAAVAKTGDMKITTPTSTLGIRGTTGLVEVPEGGGANNVNIKLYPDADGHVGRIEVNDRSGMRLGALTQGASGFTIRSGVGGARPTAVPLTISPQQVARDQGFVRQVHTAQNVGRQIVTEQRALRRASPPGPNAPSRGNRPPGPKRQNQAPGQNRPGQPQQGAPNRGGQQQRTPQAPKQTPRPDEKSNTKPGPQPAIPQRQGERPSPAQPAVRQGGLPPGPPGVQRAPGPNRPGLQKPRPPAPKREKKH
ncbi:FecR domain-containing protein [Bradyrhizobium sp. ARR65]|uniref:FecR domain-containing protein n=1 Tax=Bradyrhizobium sp. ARR65 TaxID=1040989 RepID=UPI000A8091DA|nr:FecR domain-containing protein [Bradyrhizobium sp. ARR65]